VGLVHRFPHTDRDSDSSWSKSWDARFHLHWDGIPGSSFSTPNTGIWFRATFIAYFRQSTEENMVRYKGYVIVGKALRVHPTSPEWWRSQGGVFANKKQKYIHIKHLDAGFIFESKQAAESHGLELCKKWVDENLKSSDDE
jgi:hypothetical protein